MIKIFSICWICFSVLLTQAQNVALIQSKIKEVFNLPDFRSASYGLIITDAKTGKILFSDRGEHLLVPASTLKIVTAAVALETFGENKRLTTRLAYQGTLSKEGLLQGDIRIVGGGDPTLGTTDAGSSADAVLNRWVAKIKKAGIRKIQGNIVGDGTCFSTQSEGKEWLFEDMGNYYGAAASGLCLDENRYYLILNVPAVPNQFCTVKSCSPMSPGLKHNSFVKTSSGKDDAWILGAPGQNERKIVGVVPAGKGQYTLRGTLPDPPLSIAFRLKEKLQKEGILVSGFAVNAENQKSQAGSKVYIDTLYSPSLGRILELMLIHSQNLYAENMIHLLSEGAGKEAGMQKLKNAWPAKTSVKHRNFVFDGSGLSPMNAVTCYSLAEASAAWYAKMGKKGMKERVPGVFVKSGYMERVRSYTGIIDKPGKPLMAFAFIVNQYRSGPPEMRRQMEKIMNAF